MKWSRQGKRTATRRSRSWRPGLEQVEGRQLLSTAYVLGNDGGLWMEFGSKNNRFQIDTSVQSFAPDPQKQGYLYVEGTDHKLWLEAPAWQQNGRTLVDSNVQAFAPDPTANGFVYVQRTDQTLHHEAVGPQAWLEPEGNTLVDTTVLSFAVDPSQPGFVYVEGTDQKLWLEGPNWQRYGRTLVDTSVQSFTPDPAAAGYLFVEGTDHKLWIEAPGWQFSGRTLVDTNVQAFAPDPVFAGGADGFSYLYVEDTGQTLWHEAPGWQQYGRTEIASGVQSFAPDPSSNSVYVEYTNDTLWLGRTEVDYSVRAFAPDPYTYDYTDVDGLLQSEYAATAFEFDTSGGRVKQELGQPLTFQPQAVPGVANAYQWAFQGGTIYWSPGTGAHAVYGPTYTRYVAMGGPTGYGLPIGDEGGVLGAPGLRVADFQNGDHIDSSSATGAHAVYGAIGVEYAATAYESDYYGRDVQALLGAPTSDEMNAVGVVGARMNTFQGGDIYWSSATGAHAVYGAIGSRYNSLGGSSSYLGLPTTDELSYGGGRISYFQHGYLEWTPGTGVYDIQVVYGTLAPPSDRKPLP